MKNMERNVLKGVHIQGLLDAHDPPKVQNMATDNFEGGSVSNSPLVSPFACAPSRSTRNQVGNIKTWTSTVSTSSARKSNMSKP